MSIKSADRTLDVFEVFAARLQPLALTELAERLQAPVSSCFQLMRTLERRGYAYTFGKRRGFYPTERMLRHAELIGAHDPLHQLAAPALRALRDKTNETVVLGHRVERHVMILKVFESTQSVRYSAQVGSMRPLHSTALGKALLGVLPPAARDPLIGTAALPGITANTITDRQALDRELELSRERGWYMTRGENVSDLYAISRAIELNGQTFAICVAVPVHRFVESQERNVEALLETCALLERRKPDATPAPGQRR